MINSIRIKNFETHISTDINLHPGTNIIIGESDEGKSGIIRAIKWNTQNRPQGDSYRNDQLDPKKKEDKLKTTEVKIDYDENSIIRARDGFSGGVNHYVINDQEPLRALRTDIPDEIQEITKMKSVNIQGQHPTEQYFLLSEKAGQVAKEFNKVAGLTIMDKAISDINSQVRTCNTKIKISEKEIKNLYEEIEDTEWVDKAEKFAKKLKVLKVKLKNKQIDYDELDHKIIHITKINDILEKKYNGLDDAPEVTSDLEKEKQAIHNKRFELDNLNSLISDTLDVNSQLKEYNDIDKALTSLKTLDLLVNKIMNIRGGLSNIASLLVKVKQNDENLVEAERDFNKVQKEYQIMWIEKSCPTCGRKGE